MFTELLWPVARQHIVLDVHGVVVCSRYDGQEAEIGIKNQGLNISTRTFL